MKILFATLLLFIVSCNNSTSSETSNEPTIDSYVIDGSNSSSGSGCLSSSEIEGETILHCQAGDHITKEICEGMTAWYEPGEEPDIIYVEECPANQLAKCESTHELTSYTTVNFYYNKRFEDACS